ncbi:hypothetical protein FNV43_RR21215 [Rhamnella rubrinervis]|uniref:Uncharacterized protein n=1 Tax=Rhamnella rubrinervis TaxID=2594499 RepID=A0A8K0E1W1_9ROSA|nr:hypothetical protein FNV43_RR21215 [Rhamnella rubrinervis]
MTKKRARADTNQRLDTLGGKVPDDLLIFMKKMGTYPTSKMCKEIKRKSMTSQLDNCADTSLKNAYSILDVVGKNKKLNKEIQVLEDRLKAIIKGVQELKDNYDNQLILRFELRRRPLNLAALANISGNPTRGSAIRKALILLVGGLELARFGLTKTWGLIT